MKKHIILSSLLALGISGIGGIASADEGIINGGSENVDNYNGLVRSEVSDPNDTQHNSTFRFIQSTPYDGGYWIRGTNSHYVVSKYKHYRRKARASVVNGNGKYFGTPWHKPGDLAIAQIHKTSYGNKAYYDHQ